MILITYALPIEGKAIKQAFEKYKKKYKIKFLCTGVWNFNSIYTLQNYIYMQNRPDFIVNIWVCGQKINSQIWIFQAYRIFHIQTKKETICPLYIQLWELHSLACSDTVVTSPDILWENNFVDMESYGIDYVCEKEKIPYAILKIPFDIVSQASHHVNKEDIESNILHLDYEVIFSKIEHYFSTPWNNIPDINNILTLIKTKYRFTVSEIELLKKLIFKKLAFGISQEEIISFLLNSEKLQIQIEMQK